MGNPTDPNLDGPTSVGVRFELGMNGFVAPRVEYVASSKIVIPLVRVPKFATLTVKSTRAAVNDDVISIPSISERCPERPA